MRLSLVKNNDYRAKPFVNLQQLYEFEFSPITGSVTNEDGLFDTKEIMSHWSESGSDIYILNREKDLEEAPYFEKKPIGFAVVNKSSMITADKDTRDIAEFFVLPEARKEKDLKAGTWMAHEVFKLYPGKWEVRQLPGLEAKFFWIKAIDSFTRGTYESIEMNNDKWVGTVQRFDTSGLLKA